MPDLTKTRLLLRAVGVGTLLPVAALCAAVAALAAQTVTVIQKNREFQTRSIDIARGDTIHFTNSDEFLHQIYTNAATFSFESDEQAPGEAVEIVFPVAGTFEVRCGIHPKMRLTVNVQ